MTKKEIFNKIFESPLITSWHWFQWHFKHQLRGQDHPFSDAIVTALSEADKRIPGYAIKFIALLASFSGREKYKAHYEQLLQVLAELHVIKQVVKYEWPNLESFEYEPIASGSRKNPELSVKYAGFEVGIEVKAPSLFTHINQRATNPIQITSRLDKMPKTDEGSTLPRDNPVKDFLISANDKFRAFKNENDNFYGVLVIVWDDFIYEPISALLHPKSGLFTDESFFTDTEGRAVPFPYIDGVVIIRHLHQLIKASRDEPLIDSCYGPFDYGIDGQFPQKAWIGNPLSKGIPKDIFKALQAYTPTNKLGAEYTSTDVIWWQ